MPAAAGMSATSSSSVVPPATGEVSRVSIHRVGVPAAHYGVSVKRLNKEDPNYHSPRDVFENMNPDVIEKFGDAYAVSLHHFATMGATEADGLLAAWQARNGADAVANSDDAEAGADMVAHDHASH